jgi:hypothetical protein
LGIGGSGGAVVVPSGEGTIGAAMVTRGRLVDCVVLRNGVVNVVRLRGVERERTGRNHRMMVWEGKSVGERGNLGIAPKKKVEHEAKMRLQKRRPAASAANVPLRLTCIGPLALPRNAIILFPIC